MCSRRPSPLRVGVDRKHEDRGNEDKRRDSALHFCCFWETFVTRKCFKWADSYYTALELLNWHKQIYLDDECRHLHSFLSTNSNVIKCSTRAIRQSSTEKFISRPWVLAPIIWPTGSWVLKHTLQIPKLHPTGVLLALPGHDGVYSANKLVFYKVFYPFWGQKSIKNHLHRSLDAHPYSSWRLHVVCFFPSSPL